MSDQAALLRSVLAAPDDDAPRLVYADWLDENGEPERAEFIRVQCKRAKMPEQELQCIGPIFQFAGKGHHSQRPGGRCAACGKLPGPCEYHALEDRERELFDADDAATLAWFGLPQPWAKIVRLTPFAGRHVDAENYPYAVARRGFLDSITCPAADWLAHADAILAEHPVREVTLTTWPIPEPLVLGRPTLLFAESQLRQRWPGIKFDLPGAQDFSVGFATAAHPDEGDT